MRSFIWSEHKSTGEEKPIGIDTNKVSLLESRIKTTRNPPLQSQGQHLEQSRIVLSEVLVTIGVEDGPTWVTFRQALTICTTVCIVLGATVEGEVGRLMDKRSSLGIGTGVGGLPEGAAEVDLSEFFGI